MVLDERALWLARHVLPHEPELRAWIRRRRIGTLEVDDVIQETYAILAGLASVEAIRDPRTYSFSVANSVVVSHVRRASIVSIQSVANIEEIAGQEPAPSPETAVSDREQLYRLASAIGDLPYRCRQTFILRKIEGVPQREVARRLGVSEGAVEKQMQRGIRILMDVMGRGSETGHGASGFNDRPGQEKVPLYGRSANRRRD